MTEAQRRHWMKGLSVNEISLVDLPANPGAIVSLHKRDFSQKERKKLAEEGKALPDGSFPIVTKADLENAIQAFGRADNKAQVARHIQQRARELDATDILPDEGDLAEQMGKSANGPEQSADEANEDTREATGKQAGSPGKSPTSENGGNMTEETDKELGDLNTQVKQLTKALEQHGLTVSKSDDGNFKVEKAADDEVITGPDGVTIRKSEVGDTYFNVIKAQNDRIAKMEAERKRERLAKRAEAEFPNVTGTVTEKADVLEAVDAIQNETTRKALYGYLETLNKFQGQQFTEKGSSDSSGGTEAGVKLEKMAHERAQKTGETFEKAYSSVLETDEGAKLYDQHLAEHYG